MKDNRRLALCIYRRDLHTHEYVCVPNKLVKYQFVDYVYRRCQKNNQKVYKRYLNVKSLVRNKRNHTLQQK